MWIECPLDCGHGSEHLAQAILLLISSTLRGVLTVTPRSVTDGDTEAQRSEAPYK